MWETFPVIFSYIEDVALRDKIVKLHEETEELMKVTPASVHKHHRWPGGYWMHVLEVCNNVLTTLELCNLAIVDFTLDDIIVAAYVHDLDKLFCRYERDPEAPTDKQLAYAAGLGIELSAFNTPLNKTAISAAIDLATQGKAPELLDATAYGLETTPDLPFHRYKQGLVSYVDSAMVVNLCAQRGIILTNQMLHATAFHQGGWSDGADIKAIKMESISAVLHSADLISTFSQNGRVTQ